MAGWWLRQRDRVIRRLRPRPGSSTPRSPAAKASRCQRSHPGRGAILLYHRVVNLDRDVQLLAVTPEHFSQHMEILRRLATPVRLDRWMRQTSDKRPLAGRVAVTFDDGYHDNVSQALPILERFDVPATMFVTTGWVGERREFWWDELDWILLEPPRAAATIELIVNGVERSWQLDELAARPLDADWNRWNVLLPATCVRQQAYHDLCACLRLMDPPGQQAALEAIRRQTGAPDQPRASHRALSLEVLANLSGSEILEIGAHTVNHPWLASLDAAAQTVEIHQSKRRLEAAVGSVEGFSYPFGVPGSYEHRTIQIVRDAGFSYAAANAHSAVGPDCDRFALPRFVVRDWDAEEFESRLRTWMESEAVQAA